MARRRWTAFSRAAPKYGIQVVNKYSYSLTDRQFGSIVASVKRDNRTAFTRPAISSPADRWSRSCAPAASPRRSSARRPSTSQKFIDIAGPASEGTYIVDSFDRGRNDAALQRFFAEFQKRAGYPPENVAAITYSAVKLMADAIKRADSADPAKVRDALAATKNYPLLTGELIGFNNLHEVIMPISVNVVKDGKMKFFAKLGDLEAFRAAGEVNRWALARPAFSPKDGAVYYIDLAVTRPELRMYVRHDGGGPDSRLRAAAHPAHRSCRRVRARRLHHRHRRQCDRQHRPRIPRRDCGDAAVRHGDLSRCSMSRC